MKKGMSNVETRAYDSGYKNGKFDGFVEAARIRDDRVKATEMAILMLGPGASSSTVIGVAEKLTEFWRVEVNAS